LEVVTVLKILGVPMKRGIINQQHIYAELGEIVAGTKQGRTSGKEITLFKSVGLGIEDCATAWLAYSRARKMKTRTEVDLTFRGWVHIPEAARLNNIAKTRRLCWLTILVWSAKFCIAQIMKASP